MRLIHCVLWCLCVSPAGMAQQVFPIKTVKDLTYLAVKVNSGQSLEGDTVKLMADLTLQTATSWRSWNVLNKELSQWTPIGKDKRTPFKGVFDGQGHTVRGLYIYTENEFYNGLFGVLDGATVKNVTLAESYITGYNFTGGVAAYLTNGATVSGCRNKASVRSVRNSSGGVAGASFGFNFILDCLNEGEVSGSSYAGGIAGHFENGVVRNCGNRGVISCQYGSAGGILGHWNDFGYSLKNTFNSFANCYNTGTIKGPYRLGGLAGLVYVSDQSLRTDFFANSYSTGKLVAQSPVLTDGLVGRYRQYPKLSLDYFFKDACYWADSCAKVKGSPELYDRDIDDSWENVDRDLSPSKFSRMAVAEMKSEPFLQKLNGWVDKQRADKGYRHWQLPKNGENGGFPVLK